MYRGYETFADVVGRPCVDSGAASGAAMGWMPESTGYLHALGSLTMLTDCSSAAAGMYTRDVR